MSKGRYVPARADVIMLEFDPVAGAEPGKRRPCVVLTDRMYNQSGRAMIMMFSTSIRGTLTEIDHADIDDLVECGALSHRCVLCADLVRHVDWRKRGLEHLGVLGISAYAEAIDRLGSIIGDEILDEPEDQREI